MRTMVSLRAASAASAASLRTSRPTQCLHSQGSRALQAATDVLSTRQFSVRSTPKQSKPLDTKRILETPLVENADNQLMRWVGRGSAMQMYCSIIFAGKLIYEADAGANMYEAWASSGAIASASACVFFGAKLLCDKIVTDIAACRNFGEKDEFVRLTIQGALEKYALYVSLEDVQLLEHQAPDKYKFKVGERSFSLDVSTGTCTNRKALESLLEGKPLVTRKLKQPKRC